MTWWRSRRGGAIGALRERARRLPPAVQALAFIAACAIVPVSVYVIARAVQSDTEASGPAPQTLKKAMWGPSVLPDGASAFPTYRDLGVGIYEVQVLWNQLAAKRPAEPADPSDPAYQWPQGLAKTIADAGKSGMEVSVMLLGAPAWANGGRDYIWAPTKASDFADFATAIAKRYPSVHLWMIWGEPNRAPNFQPLTPVANTPKARAGPLNAAQQVGPRKYAELVDTAYGALTAVNPENKVIAGNTFTSAGPDAIYPYQWIKYMKLPDGSRPRMDMWGHNPYGFRKPDLDHPSNRPGVVQWGDLRRLTQELDRTFPGPPMQLFLSEWGVPVGFKDKDLLYEVPGDRGVKWIQTGFELARDWNRIYTLGWIHLLDTDRASQGLLDIKGNKKQPSYDAYKDS